MEAVLFLLLVSSAPAMVVTMVAGGTCRRPGPSLSVFLLPVGAGSALRGISSPGSITVAEEAMVGEQWQAHAQKLRAGMV